MHNGSDFKECLLENQTYFKVKCSIPSFLGTNKPQVNTEIKGKCGRVEGRMMTLLSPQSIFPKGHTGNAPCNSLCCVVRNLFSRSVGGISVWRIAARRPWSKRHAEGGMHLGKKMQSREGINGAFYRPRWSMPACWLLPPTSNISVNWFGPSAGRLASVEEWALCAYRQGSCQQRPIGVFKSSNLLLNQSISRGWSCDRICHRRWEELFAAPLENP